MGSIGILVVVVAVAVRMRLTLTDERGPIILDSTTGLPVVVKGACRKSGFKIKLNSNPIQKTKFPR